MTKKTDPETRVQLARILNGGRLRVRLDRNGLLIIAENALAILAGVLIVTLVVILV